MPRLLSFVVPLYQEEANVPALRAKLEALARRLGCPCEFILVDDGSRDATAALLEDWAQVNKNARVIELSRNFGQQIAVTAGIDQAQGDAVLLLDGDLQDPPELVEALLAHYRQGFDVVNARRLRRAGESAAKRATSALFYWGMRTFVQKELPAGVGDFRLITGDVAEALRAMRESRRFMRGLMAWVGFRTVEVPFERQPRQGGRSNFNTWRLLKLAKDAVLSFADWPARFGLAGGLGLMIASALGSAGSGRWPASVSPNRALDWGWAGLILFCLGVIGEYIARIYEEAKGRPLYIVRRTRNLQVRRLPRAVFPRD